MSGKLLSKHLHEDAHVPERVKTAVARARNIKRHLIGCANICPHLVINGEMRYCVRERRTRQHIRDGDALGNVSSVLTQTPGDAAIHITHKKTSTLYE